jgi:hypothetical protein
MLGRARGNAIGGGGMDSTHLHDREESSHAVVWTVSAIRYACRICALETHGVGFVDGRAPGLPNVLIADEWW